MDERFGDDIDDLLITALPIVFIIYFFFEERVTIINFNNKSVKNLFFSYETFRARTSNFISFSGEEEPGYGSSLVLAFKMNFKYGRVIKIGSFSQYNDI